MTIYSDFRTKLVSLADEEYREFSMKGIPCDRPFLGVRIPDIRKLVKEIPQDQLIDFINETPIAIEEVIARGFAISKLPYDEMIKVFDSQIGLLDNWCTVDTFCASLRNNIKKHTEDFFAHKVEPLLSSNDEFVVRTGLVCLLDFYVQPDYLPVIYNCIESLKNREEYYIRMAMAWLLAECFVKYPSETFEYLKISKLNSWTFNKTISKICDSYRVDPTTKTQIKQLRRK